MHLLYIGAILGFVTYLSWMGYYWLYLPKRIRHWFEASMVRLFILDASLTVVGLIGFHGVSDSLTAVIAASTLGLLGTLTTIGIRVCQWIGSMLRKAQNSK
jgi:hypothetical protein